MLAIFRFSKEIVNQNPLKRVMNNWLSFFYFKLNFLQVVKLLGIIVKVCFFS